MRSKRKSSGGLSVRAIAGTHVVFLAFDLTSAARKGCHGFAIKRRDLTEQEEYWLEALKTFESVEPAPGLGVKVSTLRHPIQGFQWADYSAKAGYSYEYDVIAMYGTPENLVQGAKVTVRIDTEVAEGDVHAIHFNRGAVASQEYARRFQNRKPSEFDDGSAHRWLSRGLEEAIIAFVARAKGPSYALHAAFYEFQWPSVLAAFKDASTRGANVRVVFDAIKKKKGPAKANRAAVAKVGLKSKCIERTRGPLMHNKFIVLSKNDKPIAVWTGSTNATENGIFGHLNVGHSVDDAAVAGRFFDYWQQLSQNPAPEVLRDWAEQNDPPLVDQAAVPKGASVIFSPHKGLKSLQWYAAVAERSGLPVLITLAFGMNKVFLDVYRDQDGVLRIALLEKPGNGAGLAQGRKDIQAVRSLPNVLVAIGNYVQANKFDRWLKEIDRIKSEVNVRWVHTKFVMIDPLGDDPIVITGSANFSDASTNNNDENMLVIRGNKRVADIYFTEFLRIYSHHAFRESLTFYKGGAQDWRPNYLAEKPSDWQKRYFTQGNESFLRREYYR